MKQILALFLSIALYTTPAWAITLEWDRPLSNVDGTPITELTGYRVYTSQTAGTYTAATATVTSTGAATEKYVIPATTAKGTYFAVVTAFNSTGESAKSNEVTFTVKPGIPGAPRNVRVTLP